MKLSANSEDGAEGALSFKERRLPKFAGTLSIVSKNLSSCCFYIVAIGRHPSDIHLFAYTLQSTTVKRKCCTSQPDPGSDSERSSHDLTRSEGHDLTRLGS